MKLISSTVVFIVALIHIYILILEMFWWDEPRGIKTFGFTKEFAQATKVLGANQGLYNGFLAGGLLWSLWLGDTGTAITIFFLSCVLIAGVFGAITANRRILYVQALPAGAALILVFLT